MSTLSAHHGSHLDLPPMPPMPRSASSSAEGPPPRSGLSKAKSTNSLRNVANNSEDLFQTIRDPRMASTSDLSARSSRSGSRTGQKDEMTVLSDKLIAAINHQQALDDRLAQAQHELEATRSQMAQLEAKSAAYEERIRSGNLMTKEMAEKKSEGIYSELFDARRQRDSATAEKQKMDNELEALSASLFEEANKLVAAANERAAQIEKKNAQLRDQIKDGEALLLSQNEQLAELKTLMQQQIGDDHRAELHSPDDVPTPRSPAVQKDENIARLLEAMNLTPIDAANTDITPSPSTQLVHLVRPRCRTDIPAFEDFRQLIQTSAVRSHTPSHAPSRAGSGSYPIPNITLGLNNSSSPNLVSSAKQLSSPGLPGPNSPATDKGPAPLKDTRFFRRIITEDVEPTLRLDLSPNISWLQRRAILAAVTDSTLIVEPIPEASQKLYGRYTACSICGEARTTGENPRTHAMRVKEGETANKWSICQLCLEKVRAAADLISYVRMARDGVVKIYDLHDEQDAWDEIIKRRERLFWARMAGGVVPVFLPSSSPATTLRTTVDTNDHQGSSTSPTAAIPDQSRRPSNSSPDSELDEAARQMAEMNASLTTFEDMREKIKTERSNGGSPRPSTPRRKEGSGSSFPRINIPKVSGLGLPQGFWEMNVNTLR